VLDDRAHQAADPVNSELGFGGLNRRLPDDVVITSDSASATNRHAGHCMLREGRRGSLSGTLATMVPGEPYAISAKFAHPHRPVIGLTGDGAFQMLGMNELLTVKRYLPLLTQQNKTLVFVVLVNNDLNQVSMEQRVLGGDPKNPDTQTLPYLPCA